MTDEQNGEEKFPKDEGEHLPPHGTKPQRTTAETTTETPESRQPERESAGPGTSVSDSQKKRRTYIALLVAAIILLVLIAIFV